MTHWSEYGHIGTTVRNTCTYSKLTILTVKLSCRWLWRSSHKN